jgi:hypothetical protein
MHLQHVGVSDQRLNREVLAPGLDPLEVLETRSETFGEFLLREIQCSALLRHASSNPALNAIGV